MAGRERLILKKADVTLADGTTHAGVRLVLVNGLASLWDSKGQRIHAEDATGAEATAVKKQWTIHAEGGDWSAVAQGCGCGGGR